MNALNLRDECYKFAGSVSKAESVSQAFDQGWGLQEQPGPLGESVRMDYEWIAKGDLSVFYQLRYATHWLSSG